MRLCLNRLLRLCILPGLGILRLCLNRLLRLRILPGLGILRLCLNRLLRLRILRLRILSLRLNGRLLRNRFYSRGAVGAPLLFFRIPPVLAVTAKTVFLFAFHGIDEFCAVLLTHGKCRLTAEIITETFLAVYRDSVFFNVFAAAIGAEDFFGSHNALLSDHSLQRLYYRQKMKSSVFSDSEKINA